MALFSATIGTAASIGILAGTTAAVSGLAGTGFQIAQGVEQANLAASQRRKESALQNKALTEREVDERRGKAKKKAATFQREREAALGTSEQRGSILGGSPTGKSILGG